MKINSDSMMCYENIGVAETDLNNSNVIIARLMGGLGNQLFQYAMARRLSLVNNAELFLDNISGFENDRFKRKYSLNHFFIEEKFASGSETFVGELGRIRQIILRKYNSLLPLNKRSYFVEEEQKFDKNIFNISITRKTFLEGYWQSELYFKDIEPILRKDLRFKTPHSNKNIELANTIKKKEAVCVHARHAMIDNGLDAGYYQKAINNINQTVEKPHFYIFSDSLEWVEKTLSFIKPATIICHNDTRDYEGLWLMSLCRHFVIANSTFSWWGAWMSNFSQKTIIAPRDLKSNNIDIVPAGWTII